MELFDKIGKTASATYKTAAEKTSKFANETKLKIKISDNMSKIKEMYVDIGKKAYQKYVKNGNTEVTDEVKEDLEKIADLLKEIEEYESKKLELSSKRQCANCGNKIDVSVKFCPNCGAEQPEIKKDKEEKKDDEAIEAEVVQDDKKEN